MFGSASGVGRDRAASNSTTSSLRPMSVTSSVSGVGSRLSTGSGGSGGSGSLRWDEERLESVVRIRRREREERDRKRAREREKMNEKVRGRERDSELERENRRLAEARRRTPLSEVFPLDRDHSIDEEMDIREGSPPLVRVEAATADGHQLAMAMSRLRRWRWRPH